MRQPDAGNGPLKGPPGPVYARRVDLFDIYQQGQISRTRRQVSTDASHNDQRFRAQSNEIDLLEERIDRLTLLNEAMWRLLSEHLGFTDAHLEAKIHELDNADGNVDGRRTARPTRCGNCDSMVHPKHRICQYCGAEAPDGATPFDRL